MTSTEVDFLVNGKGVRAFVTGHDLYEQLAFPVMPRVGDWLDMGSLTMGQTKGMYRISRIEWAMNQIERIVHPWVHVRRSSSGRPRIKDLEPEEMS